MVIVECSSADAKSITAFLNLLNDDLERTSFPRDVDRRSYIPAIGFDEGTIGDVHVNEEFLDTLSTAEEEILAKETPVDLIAAVQRHFAEVCLNPMH